MEKEEAMTDEQRKTIRATVKRGEMPEIPRDEYVKLNKESAQALIDSRIKAPEKDTSGREAVSSERATKYQLNAIAEAVDNGEIERLPSDEWKNLTKVKATEIIGKLYEARVPEPATDSQKERITEFVKNGFLSAMGREKFANLDKVHASKLISLGKYHEEKNQKVEGFDPDYKPIRGSDPATSEQKETISRLVKDGYLNGMAKFKWDKLSVREASKLVYIGQKREGNGEKAPRTEQTMER